MNPIEELRQEIRDIPEIVLEMLKGDPEPQRQIFEDIEAILEPINDTIDSEPLAEPVPDDLIEEAIEPDWPLLPVFNRSNDDEFELLSDADDQADDSAFQAAQPPEEEQLPDAPELPDFSNDVSQFDEIELLEEPKLPEEEQLPDWPELPDFASDVSEFDKIDLVEDKDDQEDLLLGNDQQDTLASILDAVTELLSLAREYSQGSPNQIGGQTSVDEPQQMRWNLHDEGSFGGLATSPLAEPANMALPTMQAPEDDNE